MKNWYSLVLKRIAICHIGVSTIIMCVKILETQRTQRIVVASSGILVLSRR